MIAGFTTAGGGGIVNVKVNPSGALTVDVGASVLPTGASTSAKQDSQITLETTIASLTETIQELNQRLAFLGSIKQHQTESLRTTVVNTVPTTISSGTVTTVTNLTNFGAAYPALEMAHDINNSTAILANIQNVVVT